MRVLYILGTGSLLDTWFANIFFQSVAFFFILFWVSCEAEVYFDEVPLTVFPCTDHALGVKSKNTLPSPRIQRFFYVFFPKIFIGLCFTFNLSL